MRRSRGIALILAGGLSAAVLVGVAQATSSDACEKAYTAPMNSTAKLKAYEDCRFDRIDASQKRIEAKLDSPSPVPSPTDPPTTSPTPTDPPTTESPSPTPDPTTPAPTTPAPTVTPTSPNPQPSLSLTPVDGGTDYYGKWTKNTLPTDKAWFPLGVWMEQGPNATKLATYGVNMIVNPVNGQSTNAAVKNLSALEDEADMWAGAGSGTWTGKYPGQGDICSPVSAKCGFTVMQSYQAGVAADEMRYTNYGKGVAFWATDAQAAQFVNQYQDATSVDLYWGTDPDLCQASQGGALLGTGAALSSAECHKPANYGRTVDRVRALANPAKPILNYVEVGFPFSDRGTAMPVTKIRPAVWSSLIHGARGIVYFNHSFGGTCQSQHVLFDCDPAIGTAVKAINAEVTSLAPVLNAPTVNGVTKTGSIDQITKYDGANVYVFTGSTLASGSTSGSVTIPTVGDTTATVIGENRTVAVTGGKIADTWADPNTVHLYRVN